MKIVFNFKTALAAVFLLGLLTTTEGSARAEGVYYSTRALLTDFFRTSQNVTYKRVEIDPGMRERLAQRLGYVPARSSYTFYVASSSGRIDGYALIDEQVGEHLPITFAVKISPVGVVERQEIVCYREPRGDEVRDARFRRQFVGKTARDPIAVNRDIDAVSGATISSVAMAIGVKRALVLFDELVRPSSLAEAPVARRGTF